jgi:hypothetical protein
VTVSFHKNAATGAPFSETMIAPESAVFLTGVLADPDGDGLDTMQFAFDGRSEHDLVVTLNTEEETTAIVIPARYCPRETT